MSGDLELRVVREADDDAGFLAAFAETDQMVVAVGGDSSTRPAVLASSNARTFELRTTPRKLGLRDALVVGDAVWVCGEYGQLAATRDHGATWQLFETGTEQCLFSLALAADGAVWCAGDQGVVVRVRGPQPQRVDFATEVRLAKVYAVRDEIVVLGNDGALRRWRDGSITVTTTGSPTPLTALAITKTAWVVIGDGGFIARSSDGQWYSRVKTGSEIDLEGITQLRDGRLVVVGDRGTVLTSADEGRTWVAYETRLPLVHLWSVQRFGAGALIGGDDGLVLRLAPPDDRYWADRPGAMAAVDVAGEIVAKGAPALPLPGEPSGVVSLLDAVFRAGPEGFIARGLAAYITAIAGVDADEDDDYFADDDEPDERNHAAIQEVEQEAKRVAGDAAAFAHNYGLPLPADAAAFFHLTKQAAERSTFAEMQLGAVLRPDVGSANMFELMVRENQRALLGTDLVEAFCGVFCIGTQRNGDRYLMELYEWEEGARQVLHFDHETGAFSRVVADSLDSFLFRAALLRAHDASLISEATFDIGERALRGKVGSTFDAERRDSEFFFFRARWIIALLKNDGVTDLDAIKELFAPDFNQSVPPEQLSARYEACERYIPTALYAMWRAFLFDEPELARYVEIGVQHSARLVRDSATLIAELLAGRNTLGTITDVRAWLSAFRALDIDPRRAKQRAAEAKLKQVAREARETAVEAALDGAPRTMWRALAWAWLEDGIAHRRLLARLARGPDAALIDQLDALNALTDDARGPALRAVARELSPELEAVLVGSLVRDDKLADVLVRDTAEENASALDDTGEALDEDDVDDAPAPDPARVVAALALSERALRLAPADADVQFTHAMLLLDADDAGLPGKLDALLRLLPAFAATTRVNVAVRMGKREHARFAAAVDCVLAHPVGGVQSDLMSELGTAILAHAPARAKQFAPLVPAELDVLADLAHAAITGRDPETAMVLYDRVLALPIPAPGVKRENHLRALNNACIAAHAAKAFAVAVKIADHAQPYAQENPYIYHSAACAYASVGDYAKALEQVRRAIEADYDHVEKVEIDRDLGPLLDWPEFKALFRDWHAQKEGN